MAALRVKAPMRRYRGARQPSRIHQRAAVQRRERYRRMLPGYRQCRRQTFFSIITGADHRRRPWLRSSRDRRGAFLEPEAAGGRQDHRVASFADFRSGILDIVLKLPGDGAPAQAQMAPIEAGRADESHARRRSTATCDGRERKPPMWIDSAELQSRLAAPDTWQPSASHGGGIASLFIFPSTAANPMPSVC